MHRSAVWLFLTELTWIVRVTIGATFLWLIALAYCVGAIATPSKAQQAVIGSDPKAQVGYVIGRQEEIEKRVTAAEVLLATDREKFEAIRADITELKARVESMESEHGKIVDLLIGIAVGIAGLVGHTVWDKAIRPRRG